MKHFKAAMLTLLPRSLRLQWLRRQGLTLIFSAIYLLMMLLIVEQGRTIDSQRTLIRQLFHDSLELNAVKMKQAQAHR